MGTVCKSSKVMGTFVLLTALLSLTPTFSEGCKCKVIPANAPSTGVFQLCSEAKRISCSKCNNGYTPCRIGNDKCEICMNVRNTHEISKYKIKRCEKHQIVTERTTVVISPENVDETTPGKIRKRIGKEVKETSKTNETKSTKETNETKETIILGIVISTLLIMLLIQLVILMRGK